MTFKLLRKLYCMISNNRILSLLLKLLLPESVRAKYRHVQAKTVSIAIPKNILVGCDCESLLPGVNLIGYSRSEMGVGEACRNMAKCLDHSGYPYNVYPFMAGDYNRKEDLSLLEKESVEFKYKINLLSLNAEQLPIAASALGQILNIRYNIGYWFWELPELPEKHIASFKFLNEICAPSKFVYDAIIKRSPIPVHIMPIAVSVKVAPGITRKDFNLPKDSFLFLCMYDLHSESERKNAAAAIRAFKSAFSAKESSVGLVIKINNALQKKSETRYLQKLIDDYQNIYLINQIFTREQVNALLNNIDAVLSLHRSEGFGLVMAESMFLGKVAIATGWSGNVDFMTEKNSCLVDYKLIKLERDYGPYEKNQVWAEPDVEHASSLMSKLYNDSNYYSKVANEGMRSIKEKYNPEKIGKMINSRLSKIQV